METRRKIFRSAFDLFSERGFDGTTVEEIAARADVAKGTVFNYFPNKRSLLLAAHQEWMGRLEEDLGIPDSWKGDARSHLLMILAYLADLSIENREISRLVLFETMGEASLRLGRNQEVDYRGSAHALEELAREIIRRGQDRGEIRADADPRQAAALVSAMASSTLVRWLVRGGSTEEMKAALEAKLNLIFSGLDP